jgi:hypothetical protein
VAVIQDNIPDRLYLSGFIKVSQTFGYNGERSPILTAWLANITFFPYCVTNLLRKILLVNSVNFSSQVYRAEPIPPLLGSF